MCVLFLLGIVFFVLVFTLLVFVLEKFLLVATVIGLLYVGKKAVDAYFG